MNEGHMLHKANVYKIRNILIWGQSIIYSSRIYFLLYSPMALLSLR